VWTLHDPWAMTGHCVHPLDCSRWLTGCGKCPDLARNFTVWFDTTALVWKAKRDAYARAPLTLVVASRWMRELVARSPLLSKMPCHVIPFGLDLESWPVLDRRACRERLGIPGDGPAIAFRLPVGGDRNRVTKGVPWLLETLARLELPERATLIVFEGTRGLDPLRARYRIVELGWLDEATRVAEALTAADVFVNPSPAESFGFMALEAMACGTPVIATADTAVVESIRPPESGLAVRFGDCEALGAALSGLLADGPRRTEMGRAGRRRVEADYTHADYVRRHEELYRELAESRGGGRGVA
jgi:glycosyltransferase involved in cell wall biosynthesis